MAKVHKTKSVVLAPDQYRKIAQLCRKHPDAWANESHFIRCAVNYFVRQIEQGNFKVNNYE